MGLPLRGGAATSSSTPAVRARSVKGDFVDFPRSWRRALVPAARRPGRRLLDGDRMARA